MKHPLPILFALAVLASLPAIAGDSLIASVHVSYSGDMPVARKLFETMRASLAGTCGGQVTVSGAVDSLGRLSSEAYYSRDGAYVAEVDQQYIARPAGRCSIAIAPMEKKRLYHIAARTLYRYEANGRLAPAWRAMPLPSRSVSLFMENALGSNVGKVVATGKTGKFAGLACAYAELHLRNGGRAGEYCDHDLAAQGIRIPGKIRLQSRTFDAATGAVMTSRQAETVELDAPVPLSLFQPGKSDAAPAHGLAPAMRKWCEKQRQTTGTDPCRDDPDDDEN